MKKRIKFIVRFVVTAIVIQLAAILFFTSSGLEFIYPVIARTNAEEFNPDSNIYAVYYDIRAEVSEADLIVVGVDFNIGESYDILAHFTRFVKQYNNVSDIILNLSNLQRRYASELLEDSAENNYNDFYGRLEEAGGLSRPYIEYISDLFFINRVMPPIRQFDIATYSAGRAAAASENLYERVAFSFATVDRSAICVVDSLELSPYSEFKEKLQTCLPDKKIMFVNTYYSAKSASEETHEEFSFPFADDGSVYFVNNRDFEGFYDYYAVIAEKGVKDKRDRLDSRFTDCYFVVSAGSTAE